MGRSRIVIIDRDGRVRADPSAEAALSEHAGRYQFIQGPPGMLLLQREGSANDDAGTRTRVLLSGEVVSKTTILDLIGMIANNGWHGELSIYDGDVQRRLMLDQGALKSTLSNAPSERLGEVMVSFGMITPDQLARCVLSGSGGRRFGEIAIDQGYIDRQQLFEMLQAQAVRIFQSALLMTAGHFVFALPGGDEDAPMTTLHMPVQNLLLESVQRIDEMTVFRERIPSGALCPRHTQAATRMSLSPELTPIAIRCDGSHSILEIGRELRIDEFEVTKQVMQLLQIGYVELVEAQVLDRASVDKIAQQLNEVLREIVDTVERHGGAKDMLWTLRAWLAESEIGRIFGQQLRASTRISSDQTLERLQMLDLERPLEQLHRAAHELVSFAMFAASPALPREAERNLSKWVNQRVAKLRL